jgi:hypothetical protein
MNQLASLSESARTIALERFRILQPHLEQERFLTQVARDAGIPYRTAQRWVMHYRRFDAKLRAQPHDVPSLSGVAVLFDADYSA